MRRGFDGCGTIYAVPNEIKRNDTALPQQNIRNVAIIAHVDHGKTTLVDAFLKQSHVFRENEAEMLQNQILDFGELEKERGITINAKNISVRYKDYKINIIDTPGHSDFGGEVERTLNMADGCLLLVDAQEGPMPQTKFVLKKALEIGLKPIVVINKIDKKLANVPRTLSKIQDLFLLLASDTSQLDFPVYYAIGREGKVFSELPSGDLTQPGTLEGDITLLLEAIIERIPPPTGDPDGAFQMQVSSLEYDSHQGRSLIGRISRGTVAIGDLVVLVTIGEESQKPDARENADVNNSAKTVSPHTQILVKGTVKRVLTREGLMFVDVERASTGDIIAISGVDSTAIGATLCDAEYPDPLPLIHISDPSVEIKIEANTSPLVGRDGKLVTARLLYQRLDREREKNVGLRIRKGDDGSYYVAGRGELQLSILIETLRREGFEFQIRKPTVLHKVIDGVECEPQEEAFIEVPDEYVGVVTQELSSRKATLTDMQSENGQTQMTYHILTRYILGMRRILLTETKGTAVIHHSVSEYVPYVKQEDLYDKGSLISSTTGIAMGYSLNSIQERGQLFVKPGEDVYEGMVIGVNKYEKDLEVNPTKARHQSSVRMKHDEITQTNLNAVLPLTLDYALAFLKKDEILEVTPNNLRMRKALLSKTDREWMSRRKLSSIAEKTLKEKGLI